MMLLMQLKLLFDAEPTIHQPSITYVDNLRIFCHSEGAISE